MARCGVVDPRLSRHPVDILIRQIVAGQWRATESDVEQIVARMAAAPFDPKLEPVPPPLVGASYLEYDLADHGPAPIVHLVQRVIGDDQWRSGTTLSQYLDDLRMAVRSPHARLTVYRRRSGAIAATLTPTASVVSPENLGGDPLPGLFVVYSADRGIILSGYQVSGLETVSIPGDALWLK
jgi:hypothetical protein